jgi:hypothetical protein
MALSPDPSPRTFGLRLVRTVSFVSASGPACPICSTVHAWIFFHSYGAISAPGKGFMKNEEPVAPFVEHRSDLGDPRRDSRGH